MPPGDSSTTVPLDATDGLDAAVMDMQVIEPPPPGVCPDFDTYQSDVQLTLDRVCGACHRTDHDTGNNTFEMFNGDGGERTEEQLRSNMSELLRISDFDMPAESIALVYHRDQGDPHGVLSPTRFTILEEWIRSSTSNCPDVEADGGMASVGQFPCAAPVDVERYGTEASRALWLGEEGINVMLIGDRPANPGACGDAICHGTPGMGGALWLATNDQPGNAECNLQIVEAFIRRDEPLTSELLMRPLGESAVRPEDGMHGGAVVFRGRDDPEYVRVLQWIVEGGVR
jgi:hypothetical protein